MIRWLKFPWVRSALALTLLVVLAVPGYAKNRGNGKAKGDHAKLDKTLNRRAAHGEGTSRVIVVFKPGSRGTDEIRKHGSKSHRRLRLVNGEVAEVKNSELKRLADDPEVDSIHDDRETAGVLNRTAVLVGARAAQSHTGVTGAGIGVAVIDSGITWWHDDLTYSGSSPLVRTVGGQRVARFVDFVNDHHAPYDDNGHGTHVAGTIAGNGYDSDGARAGIAPDAHLVGLKVLDARGRGVISDVIAALDWLVANKDAYNIRVANLSVGAAVTESYWTDPLTLAAKHAADAGVVVVAAAGNLGKDASGQTQYGAITAPGNAPWVLTVGAYNHQGTVRRHDDVIAAYSSRGPSAIDFEAKPDIVAPGSGLVSLSDPSSLFYVQKSASLLSGTRETWYKPYLSLSGTSMAAPVVSGTVALMMEANPSLTPNMVKAILQFTAQRSDRYDALTQGAGFLNAQGAVQLARFFHTANPGDRLHLERAWNKQIHWGSHRLGGGMIQPSANAFELGTVWGAFPPGTVTTSSGGRCAMATATTSCGARPSTATTSSGARSTMSTTSSGGRCAMATATTSFGGRSAMATTSCGARPLDGDNIVWGTACGFADVRQHRLGHAARRRQHRLGHHRRGR